MIKRLQHIGGLLMAVLLLNSYQAAAQQESQYTQYMYDMMSINPAYAGSRGSLNIMGLYRNQWVGLDGAPETANFGMHSPIGIRGIGAGLNFTYDQIGPSKESEISGAISYTLQLNQRVNLAFGVQGGLSILDVDPNRLTIYNPNDYDLQLRHHTAPMFGTGIYVYTDNWYIGLSTPNLLKTEYYDDVQVSTASSRAHYYLTAGYVFTLSDNLKLKPATMVKMTRGAPVSVDLSLNALFYDRFTLGAAYRWDAAASALAGFQVTRNIMIGYAYDFNTTDLGHYNSGSHEVFLRFELGTRLKPKVNPRFF